MHVAARLVQLLTCPLMPAGSVLHGDATVGAFVADNAGLVMLAFTLAFIAVTAWLEARREAARTLAKAPAEATSEHAPAA